MFRNYIFAAATVFSFAMTVNAQTSSLEKGDKQFELNNFTGAIQSYTKALKNLPDNDILQAKIANAYAKMGKIDDAVQWLEKASLKNDEGVVLQLGKMYMRKGNYANAKSTFAKIADKNKEAKIFEENATEAATQINAPSKYKVTNVKEVNTVSDDMMPSFAPNGDLVFLSSRNDLQRKGAKTPVGANQLFVTTNTNGIFSKPTFFNVDLKNTFNEGPISSANNYAVLTQNNFINGIRPLEVKGLELSLRKANVDKTGHWLTTQALSVGGEGFANGMAALSEDAQTMVFASDRPGGQGGFDLYICKRNGEDWGVPINMGEINTAGNEVTPHFSGNSLYFSSDYHSGFGGYDIFRAENANGIYNDLYHLGNQVNTSADDYGFIFDAKREFGVLTSNRDGGAGGDDLYLVTTTAKNIAVIVLDEEKKPIANAKIDLGNCGDEAYKTNDEGKYTFQVIGELECSANISKDGYIAVTKVFKGSEGKQQTLEIMLKKVAASFFATVVDTEGKPIADALVRATNLANSKAIDVLTDASGKAILPIEAGANYLMYISKAKYIDLNANRKNIDAKSLNLGKFELKAVEDYTVGPTIYQNGNKPGVIITTKGEPKFTIQLAAVKGKPDLRPFQKELGNIGEVFATEGENNIFKVKVGKYATREEAATALAKIKEAGFNGVVSTNLTSVANPGGAVAPPAPIIKDRFSNYHVRLVTLSKPENFEASKVDKIGRVTNMKSGALTIFMLSDFKTLSDAKSALGYAQNAGFKDAYIVEKQGDKLTKVTDKMSDSTK